MLTPATTRKLLSQLTRYVHALELPERFRDTYLNLISEARDDNAEALEQCVALFNGIMSQPQGRELMAKANTLQ